METAIEDAGLDRGPTLTSSWDAACGALTQSLLLTRTGPRDQDLDFEQLLEPPAPGCAGSGPGDSHAAEEPGGGREPRRAREPREAAGPAGVGGGRWFLEGARLGANGARWAGEAGKLVFKTPSMGSCYNPPRPHPRTPLVFYLGEQEPRRLRKRHIVILTFNKRF